MAWLVVLVALALLAALLFIYGGRVALTGIGTLLLLLAIAVFAVRLGQEGPYAFPVGMDLFSGLANALAGALLLRLGSAAGREGGPSTAARGLLAATPLLFLAGLAAVLHEAEEVVELRFVDAAGSARASRLWIVDHEGASWAITGSEASHVGGVLANPRVELVRGDATLCRDAAVVRDRETVEAIHGLRREKYRVEQLAWAVGLPKLSLAEGESIAEIAVAIRFDPCEGELGP